MPAHFSDCPNFYGKGSAGNISAHSLHKADEGGSLAEAGLILEPNGDFQGVRGYSFCTQQCM